MPYLQLYIEAEPHDAQNQTYYDGYDGTVSDDPLTWAREGTSGSPFRIWTVAKVDVGSSDTVSTTNTQTYTWDFDDKDDKDWDDKDDNDDKDDKDDKWDDKDWNDKHDRDRDWDKRDYDRSDDRDDDKDSGYDHTYWDNEQKKAADASNAADAKYEQANSAYKAAAEKEKLATEAVADAADNYAEEKNESDDAANAAKKAADKVAAAKKAKETADKQKAAMDKKQGAQWNDEKKEAADKATKAAENLAKAEADSKKAADTAKEEAAEAKAAKAEYDAAKVAQTKAVAETKKASDELKTAAAAKKVADDNEKQVAYNATKSYDDYRNGRDNDKDDKWDDKDDKDWDDKDDKDWDDKDDKDWDDDDKDDKDDKDDDKGEVTFKVVTTTSETTSLEYSWKDLKFLASFNNGLTPSLDWSGVDAHSTGGFDLSSSTAPGAPIRFGIDNVPFLDLSSDFYLDGLYGAGRTWVEWDIGALSTRDTRLGDFKPGTDQIFDPLFFGASNFPGLVDERGNIRAFDLQAYGLLPGDQVHFDLWGTYESVTMVCTSSTVHKYAYTNERVKVGYDKYGRPKYEYQVVEHDLGIVTSPSDCRIANTITTRFTPFDHDARWEQVAEVPAPAAAGIFGLGLFGLGALRRRMNNKKAAAAA